MLRDIRFLLKQKYSNNRALIIGINKYINCSPLSYAVSDAEAIRETLVKDFDFPEPNVVCLLDTAATKAQILHQYLKFSSSGVEADDKILVFFAGHGRTYTGIRGEVGYLAPVDADINDLSTFIRWEELTANSEIIRAKHMLFIMDACYGGLALTRSLEPGSARFLDDMLLRYSRQVLTAGKADETVADSGGPIPNHSVFTGHLLEGLKGKAFAENGVLTANGLMSYVYSKVANDKNSHQSPHYGYFDGDGDFIFKYPKEKKVDPNSKDDNDTLITIPGVIEDYSSDVQSAKIIKVKAALAKDSSAIELHDLIITEVKRFLSADNDDCFKVSGTFSIEELLKRIACYENVVGDIAILSACIAYWGKIQHGALLKKIFSRSIDRVGTPGGIVAWDNLRWYPLIIELYSAGIAAVENGRYDSLTDIFSAPVSTSEYRNKDEAFVEAIGRAILEFNRTDVFKQLPGYERKYTPMSEYLHKLLQPKLDDVFFIGKRYDDVFDEFEVLLALVIADLNNQRQHGIWGPIGRFGWRQYGVNPPLNKVLQTAKAEKENWAPIKNGLFGGRFDRFEAVANYFQEFVSRAGWH